MGRRRWILQAVLALAVVWGGVWAVRTYAGSKRVTADRVERTIEDAQFEDWSEGVPLGESDRSREQKITEVADLFNRLDFAERQRAREERVGEKMFSHLTPNEKERFVDLTLRPSMETFMEAVDAMSPAERRKVVEDGLRQIDEGRTEEEMQRAREVSDDLLNKVTREGLRAYFEKAGADTKLDLAPLMEAMDGVMKGMSGNDFMRRD
ncbi:hypothetical protein HNR46_003756 [Haloferula luteola]|uniref:Uncharacterized protein n=1 Tax=Haloferula luteola TaxID=595692 RepID=A0A840V648_9BACT|nr:hypothetical protein [Haloferula luteola]MBB5353495.1 hypothetical protein [Haloferula luteola]